MWHTSLQVSVKWWQMVDIVCRTNCLPISAFPIFTVFIVCQLKNGHKDYGAFWLSYLVYWSLHALLIEYPDENIVERENLIIHGHFSKARGMFWENYVSWIYSDIWGNRYNHNGLACSKPVGLSFFIFYLKLKDMRSCLS